MLKRVIQIINVPPDVPETELVDSDNSILQLPDVTPGPAQAAWRDGLADSVMDFIRRTIISLDQKGWLM